MSDERVQSVDPVGSARPTPAAPPVPERPPARPAADRIKVSDEAKHGEEDRAHSLDISWTRQGPGAGGDGKDRLALHDGQTLRRGADGDEVRHLQELLNKGGAHLEADGKLGSHTENAIRKFQKEHHLAADGVVGAKTLRALHGDEDAPKAEAPAKSGDARTGLDGLPAPLQKHADAFKKCGEKYGVDPKLLAAISMHETGNGTSHAFRHHNNAMGISGSHGPLRMPSVDHSIEQVAKGLADPNGYYKGKSTIAGIGSVYAPIGAANDPRGLNNDWVRGVSENYRKLGGDPRQKVLGM